MKRYDVIVIGSGAGGIILEAAYRAGNKCAYVDRGPLGGTCLNVGCIPSKILIHPADRVMEIREARKLGIDAEVKRIDFPAIMERMRQPIRESQLHMREGLSNAPNLDFYKTQGHFIADYTLDVAGETIQGEKIFIVAGARPLIPPIRGLDRVKFLTNESLLDLQQLPRSVIIIGGGYIAAEYGHFLSAMGSTVTILQRARRLIPNTEPEIAATLQKALSRRMTIHTNAEAVEVSQTQKDVTVLAKDQVSGKESRLTAEQILIAAGRQSNADTLNLEKTGVKTDDRGFIIVNDYLETSKPRIWALGDVIGRFMFRHVANEEAAVAWRNATGENRQQMNYSAIPFAIFTYPQIAGVGLTQEEAARNHDILVGIARYKDIAKGEAMMEEEGFAKAIVEKKTWKILGFHIIGPDASVLIQEVVNLMALGGSLWDLGVGIHIHPALPELILSTLGHLSDPLHMHEHEHE
jgi:dihydrolipoamide dehydrogenase